MKFLVFLLRNLCKFFWRIYYKKVHVIGEDNIPDEGPVVLCGKHSNHIMDGYILYSCSTREVNLLGAATSFKKTCIGTLGKLANVIPINRPQDFMIKATGKAKFLNSKELKVKYSHFLFRL